jgi:ribosomal protein S18 acetylase RimI-like enzyme
MLDVMSCIGLHALGEADLERAGLVFREAFWNDPFFSYVMGGADYDRAAVTALHRFTLRYGLLFGKAYATSEELEGVALWLPPGATHMSAVRSIRAGALSLGKVGRGSASPRRAVYRRLLAYSGYSAAIHERIAPFPHWYLLAMGIADAHRGKGCAGRLLRPVLQSLDAEGLPCYLETHNPANPAFYEHFGFTVAFVGLLPGSDMPHWAMLRR